MNQYNKEIGNMMNLQISQLESKDSLTEEEKATLKSLKDTKNISAYEKELAKLEKSPVRNPGVPGGRMSEAEAKAYAEQSKAYWDYENKKKDLKKKIENIQRANGTYVNKWYEDIGESITKTNAQWKKGVSSVFKGEGLGELGNAVKQTVATGAVVYNSARSGVLKVGELVFDGVTGIVGSVAAGVTWLAHDSWSDNDVAGNVMDWTLDEMRKDRVGDANKNFYENSELGKWINKNSNLKYDSAGAQSIQTATEFAGKIALATAATVVSGGAAAAAIGAVYGVGKAGEKYTQSVDRENGENYNYLKFLGKSAAGGLSGAAEFYGYGQMGAGIYNGVKSLSSATTSLTSNATTKTATSFGKSFAKNFLEVDTFLDSGAVIVDHGVNLVTGDETLTESLKNAGIELGFALGLNAISAGIGTKVETKAAKVDIDANSLPHESTSVKKILGDKISVVSTKVKTAGSNFAESLKNVKTKLDLMTINISTNPTVNNILSSPMMAELATNSDSAILFGSASFIKESLNVLANKRAVKEVIENADFTQKILKEGMVHFTPSEDVADAIISSQVLKTKKLGFDITHPIKSVKNDVEYLANQGSKAFLFGGIPSYEEMVLNVDIQPTMVCVRIKPDESQLANLGYRYLDDNALIHNGDLDLSPSKSVEKVYVGLKQDKATNRFYYEEITKAEFDNYKLDIDESEFKKLKSTVAKTKTQIDLTYGNMKSQLDAKIVDDGIKIQKETFNKNVDNLRKLDNHEEIRKIWQDDLNAVFGESNVEAEDINKVLWLSSKHGTKPEWENVSESDFIESLYLKKDTLSVSQIEELKNNKYWQRLVIEEQEKFSKFAENLEEWKNTNELKILNDEELRNISKIENYSEARKAYNNARYTYLTKNLEIDLNNVPENILTTEVLGLHHNIADKINNNATSYYKKVCMADLVGSTTRPGTNPDGLVSEFYLRDNGSTFLEKFLKENRYDYNSVQNMNVDIVDSIKQAYPDINLGEKVETGNLVIDLLEHDGKYYVGGDGNHRMVVAKLKYMQEIANAKTAAEIAEINAKYTFTLPVKSLDSIPKVDVSDVKESLDNVFNIKNPELNSKNTFDNIYNTLYNKYGEEEALSRMSKYIETGNANIITRDNNARALISSLSMEELAKHVDDIKGSSYFKVAGDLDDVVNNTYIVTQTDCYDAFNTMRSKFGEEEAIERIRTAISTGQYNLITREGNARQIVSSLNINDFDIYLKNIKMSEAYNGLLYRYDNEFELDRRIQKIVNTNNWNYLDNSNGLVSDLYNYTGGNLEKLDEFLISKKISKYSNYELVGTEIAKVGDSSKGVNMTKELKFFKIYDSSNNTNIYVQQNLNYQKDLNSVLAALEDLKRRIPNTADKINNIYLTDIYCPADQYWSKVHNRQFFCDALGGGGDIQFFAPATNESILGTIYHESAHTLDIKYDYINQKSVFEISDSDEWKQAVLDDDNWVSEYAEESFSRDEGKYSEDFADSIRELRMTEDINDFVNKYSNRAKILYTLVPELFN